MGPAFRIPPLVLTLPLLAVVVSGVTAPLGGSHAYRQAQTAANIDKFVRDGLSLQPSTYNDDVPYAAYDFPLYQLLVAGASRVLLADPLRTARIANLLGFLAALAVLHRLLAGAEGRRWPRGVALALFAGSPLALFYFQAPMIDGLAVLLSLVSLQQYVSLGRGGGARARAVMLVSGFLSTLVKSPVYLPVFVAILWHCARRQGLRALAGPDTGALIVAAGLGVLCFKVFWMTVNEVSSPMTPWEVEYYFGTLAERLRTSLWSPVASDLLRFTTNPVVAALAAGGAVYWIRRARGPFAPLFTGLLVGCGVTLLVFFHLYPPHNYYQLPFVFPLAFLGAQGLSACRTVARAGRRWKRPLLRAAGWAVPVAVLATGVASWTGYRSLGVNRTVDAMRARGEWVRDNTNPGDYVIFLLDTGDDWNPTHLYFAKRDGYNLQLGEADRLPAVARLAHGRAGRVLAFTFREEGRRILTDLGAELLASDGRRALFSLAPATSAELLPDADPAIDRLIEVYRAVAASAWPRAG